MLKSSERTAIRLRGVRHNNLKNFDLDLPLNQLIVITGLSGSGKSSLAFDTLFAEGQRRYIETFSPYARQFFDRMDKPQVDSIEGIPPAIAIEQRNAVRTTRSTVGTMTELCDYMKVVWPHVAQLHCRQCGRSVSKDSPQQIWDALAALAPNSSPGHSEPEVLVTFDLPLAAKLSLEDSLALVARQGYQRLVADSRIIRLEDFSPAEAHRTSLQAALTVVQDRVRLACGNRARFVEACEHAYHFGKGKLEVRELSSEGNLTGLRRRFSNRFHCAECDLEYREPASALFSFNHPVGACPTCRGFGRVIGVDYDLVLPERTKTLSQGVVKPWQSGLSAECQDDLLTACDRLGVPTDVPFNRLSKQWQDLVIQGEPGYGKDSAHQWPHAWYGVKGYFRWLESKAYKMHVRVLLSRYRSYTPCPDCKGRRFQPETLQYRVTLDPAARLPWQANRPGQPSANRSQAVAQSFTLADFYQMPVRDALPFVASLLLKVQHDSHDPLRLALGEVQSRLGYLNEVGLGYLTLDRATRSLSGGETERVNLTTCLGSRLVNTLFVLDEPSVGLHARDTQRLVRILQQLRDAGNTVVVVEHEASVIRAADRIIDLGPGHGATGGQVIFQGPYQKLLKSRSSLTGQYLSGSRNMELSERRKVAVKPSRSVGRRRPTSSLSAGIAKPCPLPRLQDAKVIRLTNANLHNLKNVDVEIPLQRLVCVTGVSGSGKTTLVRDILLPAVNHQLNSQHPEPDDGAVPGSAVNGEDAAEDSNSAAPLTGSTASVTGVEHLSQLVLVDQTLLSKSPRSNPAVYAGVFEDIRELFAQSESARQRGLNASAFSFNSSQGQCENCRGCGFEKIEMQFLSDVFIRCPECDGRRYRPHILEIRIGPNPEGRPQPQGQGESTAPSFSIADILDATVEEAVACLGAFPDSRPAQRAIAGLRWLGEVGLGYLKLGQPLNTLSGGESQRLKLVKHLAAVASDLPNRPEHARKVMQGNANGHNHRPTLFLFDEPTTGLHFEDVRILLRVFQRLVDAGHSLVVIEHNLDVIRAADWVIDLGPDAGEDGGRIVAVGTPEQIAACSQSHTGRALQGADEVHR